MDLMDLTGLMDLTHLTHLTHLMNAGQVNGDGISSQRTTFAVGKLAASLG